MLSEKDLKEKKLELSVKIDQLEKEAEQIKEESGVTSTRYLDNATRQIKIYNQIRMIQWVLGYGAFPE